MQRKHTLLPNKRIADEDSYCYDEFSIVIKHKSTASYNRKGTEANQVKELQDLASRAGSGLVTFRYGDEPVGKMHIVFPLTPKKMYDFDSAGKQFVKG